MSVIHLTQVQSVCELVNLLDDRSILGNQLVLVHNMYVCIYIYVYVYIYKS